VQDQAGLRPLSPSTSPTRLQGNALKFSIYVYCLNQMPLISSVISCVSRSHLSNRRMPTISYHGILSRSGHRFYYSPVIEIKKHVTSAVWAWASKLHTMPIWTWSTSLPVFSGLRYSNRWWSGELSLAQPRFRLRTQCSRCTLDFFISKHRCRVSVRWIYPHYYIANILELYPSFSSEPGRR
jgi:hypothetical protein